MDDPEMVGESLGAVCSACTCGGTWWFHVFCSWDPGVCDPCCVCGLNYQPGFQFRKILTAKLC